MGEKIKILVESAIGIIREMDIEFLAFYIVVPIIVGIGILNGKKTGDHLRTGRMLGIKAVMYGYYAISSIVNYINDSWALRYLAGLTIGLAIMDGFAGMAESIDEIKKNSKSNMN